MAPMFSLLVFFVAAYFLLGWMFLPSSFPLAKVWPLTYVIFFSFLIAFFREELATSKYGRMVLALFVLYVMGGFLLAFWRVIPLGGQRMPFVGVHTLPTTWHVPSFERDINKCLPVLRGHSVYLLADPVDNSCVHAFYENPYLNMMGVRTAVGGIFEVFPAEQRVIISELVNACRLRDINTLRDLLPSGSCAVVPIWACGSAGGKCGNLCAICKTPNS
jgi:hypothetical protein